MRIRRKAGNPRKRGWALLFTMLAMFMAAASIAIVLQTSMTSRDVSELSKVKKQAAYVAHGAIEIAKSQLEVAVANFEELPTDVVVQLGPNTAEFSVVPSGFVSFEIDPSGIQTQLTGYEIEAVCTIDGRTERAHRLVNVEATPVFQFAVFYANDLEILPGPSMTLGGRVHTNGSMYLGSGNTLTVNTNYCRAAGGIFRHRKNAPGKSTGTVRVRQWVADPFDPSEPVSYVEMNSRAGMLAAGVPSLSGYDSNFVDGWDINGDGDFDDPGEWAPWTMGAYEMWAQPFGYTQATGHTVLSDEHGMSALQTPGGGSIDMYEDVSGTSLGDYVLDASTNRFIPVAPGTGTHRQGYYHDESDLSVIAYQDGTWDAFDSNGASVKGALSSVDAVSLHPMYDARQGGEVQVIELNIENLNLSGVYPANGLLFAASYGAGTGTDVKGVKLVAGEELAAPLTVVTENSIYVQGDYNTVNKVGASVIGDAVNLLSNAWDDSKSQGQLPVATATTYNVALVTGNHDSSVGSYNGGLENLPRFHESWAGVSCKIKGSFVNTLTSSQATGPWVYGGEYYKAPTRDWYYDEDFNNIANLPPFTPMAVRVRDVVSW